ncbi:endonuclease/exonuclease/phosphatase family protein [Croceitalea rosinachiae]|uniref:Endonuclease/exonuclease/phosphatase family protein n=1 Tax=Croceitalea rosinachiae TaxID=3075596 RepID=A0ABU3A8I9_9FLAO|nr:endonuclease/exonuclease/phosphatase family protein [Croceitalea sp. F388]MDT0606502.1 endonuclease/exonuclease/phosphatase family protein [Croceitalea sp. F388]
MKVLFSLIFLCSAICFAQSTNTYKVRTVAFYNVENLFDTKNDTLVFDCERTPMGDYRWTEERYQKKIANISKVLYEIGNDVTTTSPDVIGLCEVEKKAVIEDLIAHDNLRDENYGIIHFNSPDERGIDVALLYKKEVFMPTSFKSQRVLLFDTDGQRDYTRDQLIVGGLLDDEQFYFIVNHWPSRSGGEARSKPNRIKAAQQNKRIIDSIQKMDGRARVISMGDFNDDPIDDSFKKVLKTVGKSKKLDSITFFNPMEKLFKRGVGSLAYRDKWNLFDQFFFTSNLISKEKTNYSYWKVGVFNPIYLQNQSGKYKGYPFRTYVGTTYQGGYADHFPIYLYLLKTIE